MKKSTLVMALLFGVSGFAAGTGITISQSVKTQIYEAIADQVDSSGADLKLDGEKSLKVRLKMTATVGYEDLEDGEHGEIDCDVKLDKKNHLKSVDCGI